MPFPLFVRIKGGGLTCRQGTGPLTISCDAAEEGEEGLDGGDPGPVPETVGGLGLRFGSAALAWTEGEATKFERLCLGLRKAVASSLESRPLMMLCAWMSSRLR